jgi:hypothetical protein
MFLASPSAKRQALFIARSALAPPPSVERYLKRVRDHCVRPRCDVSSPASSRVVSPSAPPTGFLGPLRISASRNSTRSRPTSKTGPISLRSPLTASCDYANGSTLRVRYHSPRLAAHQISWNRFGSTPNQHWSQSFLATLFAVSSLEIKGVVFPSGT